MRMSSLGKRTRWAIACMGLGLAIAACGDEEARPGGLGGCVGEGCTGGTTVTPTPDAGAADSATPDAAADAPATTTLNGTVAQFTDDMFSQLTPFSAPAQVRFPTALGDDVVSSDPSTGFTATNVVVGAGWFFAAPEGAGAGTLMLPTYSLLQVPAQAVEQLVVPMVDPVLLNAIYSFLPVPTAISATASQIILIFMRGGSRVAGISLLSWPAAEALAYDQGVGYATDAQSTGSNGVALLINVTGAGQIALQLPDGSKPTMIPVHVAGGATVIPVEVP